MTLHLPPDSPLAVLPWVVTVGPLDDEEEWDPAVFGPYERAHALALARAVVADDDLMAVVEPTLPLAGVDAIRDEVERLRTGPADGEPAAEAVPTEVGGPPEPAEVEAGWRRIAGNLTR